MMTERMTLPDNKQLPMTMLKSQRSHVLFVLSNAVEGQQSRFLEWYQGEYREMVLRSGGVLRAQHYEQHEVDVTRGRFPPLPFHYLGIHELSLDGAQEAEVLIEQVTSLHRDEPAAQAPATWIYYPISEKVGHTHQALPSLLVLAFANGLPGREIEFREWYVTRHIRHALQISTLVSGQCFQRSQFQKPGAFNSAFNLIAVYEQVGTPEDFLRSHAAVPKGALTFPTLDLDPSRFAEWMYRPL